jgi:hypothetical protein
MTSLPDSSNAWNDGERLPRRVSGPPSEGPQVRERPADFFSSVAVLGHHRRVVGVGLILTLVLAMVAVALFPPTFKANGSSILLASPTSTTLR